MPKITSHRHRTPFGWTDAWGSRENCAKCSAEDARMEKARQHCAEQLRQAETLKAEELKVDADGVLQGEF